ncbi:MAG: metal-sensing transcriptional repressor [Firmicutes bacterium]|nr:metal-sensing transcriptional repressor [Bacillota bacterium]
MKADHKEVIKYLNTAKGQIEGILKMVDEDRYCIEISHQLLASTAILKKANQLVLQAHLNSCVKDTLTEDATIKIQEIIQIIDKLNK